jgi:hypothetical protein
MDNLGVGQSLLATVVAPQDVLGVHVELNLEQAEAPLHEGRDVVGLDAEDGVVLEAFCKRAVFILVFST